MAGPFLRKNNSLEHDFSNLNLEDPNLGNKGFSTSALGVKFTSEKKKLKKPKSSGGSKG